MFDLFLFLKPEVTICYHSWKEYKGFWYKIKHWQSISGLFNSLVTLLFIAEDKWEGPVKYHRARGTFITEHPCLEEVQLSKGGAPRNCECHVRMKCLSGRDNPLYLPLMQTRAQVAKNREVKNSLGLKVTSGNTVLNFWIKNDNVKRLKLLPLLLTAFCDNHNTYSM